MCCVRPRLQTRELVDFLPYIPHPFMLSFRIERNPRKTIRVRSLCITITTTTDYVRTDYHSLLPLLSPSDPRNHTQLKERDHEGNQLFRDIDPHFLPLSPRIFHFTLSFSPSPSVSSAPGGWIFTEPSLT